MWTDWIHKNENLNDDSLFLKTTKEVKLFFKKDY